MNVNFLFSFPLELRNNVLVRTMAAYQVPETLLYKNKTEWGE